MMKTIGKRISLFCRSNTSAPFTPCSFHFESNQAKWKVISISRALPLTFMLLYSCLLFFFLCFPTSERIYSLHLDAVFKGFFHILRTRFFSIILAIWLLKDALKVYLDHYFVMFFSFFFAHILSFSHLLKFVQDFLIDPSFPPSFSILFHSKIPPHAAVIFFVIASFEMHG